MVSNELLFFNEQPWKVLSLARITAQVELVIEVVIKLSKKVTNLNLDRMENSCD